MNNFLLNGFSCSWWTAFRTALLPVSAAFSAFSVSAAFSAALAALFLPLVVSQLVTATLEFWTQIVTLETGDPLDI